MNKMFQESGSTPHERAEEASRLLKMLEGAELFIPSEEKFVMDLRERFEQYGLKTQISPKQLFWLRDIKDKSL